MPPAGHALWAEVGRGITSVTSGENAWQLTKMPHMFYGTQGSFMKGKAVYASLSGTASLHGYYACMVYLNEGALRRNCRQKHGETFFFSFKGFSVKSEFLGAVLGGLILWHLWIGRARHPGPASPIHQVGLEVFNVGGWLTHGDLALRAQVDFLAVVEHRLMA